MKRLIVCCDGTWNNPEQEENGIPAPTNVYKLYNALAAQDEAADAAQLSYYHPGVGGEGGLMQAVLGGALGVGISRHICSAYHWLGQNYAQGDEIFLFGFSRGAFTARSLGGFLGHGLLQLQGLEPEEAWRRVHKAYAAGYRKQKAKTSDWAKPDWDFFHQGAAVPIRFIGVWDTVGALGVPDDLEILNFFDDKKKWQFHDTALAPTVQTARHAMAIDEIRSSFSVTRWQNAAQHSDARELWFPGVHSDVGGGYADCELSHGALLWMLQESAKAGLKFRSGVIASLAADPLGVMHNSYKGAFAKLRSRPRNIAAMTPENADQFHASALKRQLVSPLAYAAYHPTRLLAVDESLQLDVFAGQHWNYSGVYLPAGQSFLFSASGQWQDSKDSCDWRGTEDDKLSAGDIVRGVSAFLGTFEGLFKKLSKNEQADFWGTKRVEKFNWFTLVGAITNDAGSSRGVKHDGSPVPHQYVDLTRHEKTPLKTSAPGYLYCFPNDVWSLYGNNRGSVQLTITRVS